SIVFPQVRVGSTLILKYKVVTSPPPIPGFWSYKLSFNPGVFIEKFNLIARSEKPLTYKLLDPRGKIKVKRTYSGSILARLRA
ncbi:hypothetical protein AAEH85_22265, partial [Shewanella algae]|uniref:hypothetical protein n=1 Tax=Shewanella algae TaxID=38313 RepID=UPI00313F0C9A